MLLRRITKHVTDQNWFAVFIDFIIVVVGVFIGIQVANWNEERANRSLETQYLERIYADTQRLIDGIDEGNDWNEDQMITQEIVLNALTSGVLKPEDEASFQRGLSFFGYAPIHVREMVSVQELKSSGRMSLISNVELRELIGLTEQQLQEREDEAFHLKENRRKHLSEVSRKWQFVESDLQPYGKTKIIYEFEELRNNKEFINRLSQMKSMFQVQLMNAELDKQDLIKLRESVKKVLENSKPERG